MSANRLLTNKNGFYAMTVLAGLASGVLFLALVSGVSAMPVIGYFVQLPLFFVGFALGLASATLASAGSIVIVLLATGFSATGIYVLTQLVPVLVLVRFALLSRQHTDQPAQWYPTGLLLSRLLGVVLVITIGLLIWTIIQSGSLDALFGDALRELEAGFAAQGMPAEISTWIEPLLPFLPGIIACSWLIMVVVNASLGQWLATQQGQALRPSPRLRDLELSAWILPAFAASAVLASLFDGNLQFLAATSALILAMPFLFLGLAVVHTLSARLASPRLALGGFYLALVLFAWPLFFVVLGLGVIETWAQIRRRVA